MRGALVARYFVKGTCVRAHKIIIRALHKLEASQNLSCWMPPRQQIIHHQSNREHNKRIKMQAKI